MTGKSNKELQEENSELKQRLNNLASNFDNLSEEHKTLQIEFKQEKEKGNRKCNNCEKKSENVPNLKKHRSYDRSTVEVLKCDLCTKEFNEVWKMEAHKKKHKMYPCDQCEQTFEYGYIKKKHMLV